MKSLVMSLLSLGLVTSVWAKGNGASKEAMVQKMATACKAELAKDPAIADTTDGEAVWKNLEDKEHGQIKLSKNCNRAHENYEQKFHKGEDDESTEKH